MTTEITLAKRYVLAGTPGWGEHDHTIRSQGLAVANAPRPLIGNPTWYGDWMHGRHYAAGPLDQLVKHWHADDAVLLVELTPQTIVRKVASYITSCGHTLEKVAESYEDAVGDLAHEMGLPWDDAWLQVAFLPAPKGVDAFTRIPVCEHNVQAQAWFLQVVQPGNPLPEDVELGLIGQGAPDSLLTLMARAAAIEGRADQFQISYLHKDLCRTADDPAGI
ncbi:hypothetical protein [Nonomuraea cavernae]|uniref:Uncharacterized protein n=1 Tax=Nonomuraea cavernae TaxID=2045107 RepID=A0A917YSI4_9ACTN|nr:hypothetical protein [Nonomuraea cavernae]MCA2184718.1 hypothetical protein [Nonomuraea cavernae]GGO62968.1 hypothetical protein GCM10012289_08780 [Nonomuraea cavernae]